MEAQAQGRAVPPVVVVIPTFDRVHGLRRSLEALAPLGDLVREVRVVDNGAAPAVQEVCAAAARSTGLSVRCTTARENGGPAGATAAVMEEVRAGDEQDGWVLRLDDDRPADALLLRRLLAFGQQQAQQDATVAAVGLEGAVWNARRARLRPPTRVVGEPVDVDYLKTGHYPLYRFPAIRAVGGFRADLFFGMTEVEYGLRLRRAGWRLVEAGPLRAAAVAPVERTGSRSPWPAADWRRYYSLRNLLVILRDGGQPWVAVRVALIRGLLKPVAGVALRRPDALLNLRLAVRAVRDAYTGRLGRTLDPAAWQGTARDRHGDRAAT